MLNAYKVVDCTHTMDAQTFTFMNSPIETELFPSDNYGEPGGYLKAQFTLGCDVGTHIDTGAHFFPESNSVTDYTIEEMVAPGVVIDVTAKVEASLETE